MPNIFTNCLSGLHLTILSFLAYKNPLGFPYAKELSAKRPRKDFHRFLFMHVETLSRSSKITKQTLCLCKCISHQCPMQAWDLGLSFALYIILIFLLYFQQQILLPSVLQDPVQAVSSAHLRLILLPCLIPSDKHLPSSSFRLRFQLLLLQSSQPLR